MPVDIWKRLRLVRRRSGKGFSHLRGHLAPDRSVPHIPGMSDHNVNDPMRQIPQSLSILRVERLFGRTLSSLGHGCYQTLAVALFLDSPPTARVVQAWREIGSFALNDLVGTSSLQSTWMALSHAVPP